MSNNHRNLSSEKLLRLFSSALDVEEPICVLIVDDSKTVRLRLRQYLAMLENVAVLEAGTLAEACAILQEHAQSLFCAVLDLTLPDADGLDVVEAVRGYKVPSIVLTGTADPSLRQAVLELRVIDYMLKSNPSAVEDIAYLVGRLRQNVRMKVMIVDDSKTFRLHATGLLSQYRYVTLTASNGREALEIIKKHPDIALILTDYHMPEMNGLEMIQHIRKQYRREDLAIIAMSDFHRPELSATMLKVGANDYLNKGFQAEEFYCRVVQNTNMVHFVRELRDMSNRDYLTRLYNRRHLFQTGETWFSEACRGERRLAVAMVDVDHFKRVNDTHGHTAGDEALKLIAGVMRQHFGHRDFVARYGGEEFVCLVNIDDENEAAKKFELLRAAIEKIDFHSNGVKVPLTISIGWSDLPGKKFTEMIECADLAVYLAKSSGRNRVVQFSEEVKVPPASGRAPQANCG